MFTGIIENMGVVTGVIPSGTNKTFWIESGLAPLLSIDQSLAHNGVCLTVEEIRGDRYRVTAVAETLKKTNLGTWEAGSRINLERSLLLNSRLDGHFVQGHVDGKGKCRRIRDRNGSHEFQFRYPGKFASLLIEKGSVCINGISLTAFDVKKDGFRVAVIPYTYDHTNLRDLKEGEEVNLEFDLIGKYIFRKLSLEK